MRPDRQTVVGDIAQRSVQLLVPVIQIDRVRRFEGQAIELEHHHEIAAVERDNGIVDVSGIWEIARGLRLVLEDPPRRPGGSAAQRAGPARAARPSAARRLGRTETQQSRSVRRIFYNEGQPELWLKTSCVSSYGL